MRTRRAWSWLIFMDDAPSCLQFAVLRAKPSCAINKHPRKRGGQVGDSHAEEGSFPAMILLQIAENRPGREAADRADRVDHSENRARSFAGNVGDGSPLRGQAPVAEEFARQ